MQSLNELVEVTLCLTNERTNVRHSSDLTATVDIRARNCRVPQSSIQSQYSVMVSPYNYCLRSSKSSHHHNIRVAEIKRNSIQKKGKSRNNVLMKYSQILNRQKHESRIHHRDRQPMMTRYRQRKYSVDTFNINIKKKILK